MAIITVSRGSMSGGEALAKCASEKLGYPLIGREILMEAASKLGVAEDTLRQKLEKSPGMWGRLVSNRRLYIIGIQAALAEHAAGGNLVYHGNAGHLLLRDIPAVLRVRLIAPLEMRVRTLMERQQMSREDAADYIQNVDADRVRWTKFIYGRDWSDPSLYDLVINLEKMSLETACGLVCDSVSRPEFTASAEIRKALADFRLACHVKVALAANVETRAIELETRASDGVVQISGEMPTAGMMVPASGRTEAAIVRLASEVPGVQKVLLDVRKTDAYH
jgi:cytidylate kinase